MFIKMLMKHILEKPLEWKSQLFITLNFDIIIDYSFHYILKIYF
uniref:Uncharacterized protein n=1 Tax=Anopheles albimanus TaxID=7167 RepID=A0A182FYP3_ANOAL